VTKDWDCSLRIDRKPKEHRGCVFIFDKTPQVWFLLQIIYFFLSRFACFFSLAVFWGFFFSLFFVSLPFDILFTSGKFM